MAFWQRFRERVNRLMVGRHGADELSLALLIAGLVLSMLSRVFRLVALDLLGIAAYIYAIVRMFSRQHEKRYIENQKYIAFWNKASCNARQFIARVRNQRKFKYFKCPQCNARLRLPRNVGEVTVTCGNCHHAFKQKA